MMSEMREVSLGYIGGTSFCGSTLMSFLLNAQPGVTCIGEVAWRVREVNPGSFPCSCGATLDTCEFWTAVSQAMKRRGHLFDAEHWNTDFEVATNKIVHQIALRPLGSGLAEELRDELVRKVPAWEKQLSEIGKRNAALIDSVAAITGASAFVDASKDPARVKFLRQYCATEPRVIHLVRDSPAFVNSVTKKLGSDSKTLRMAIRWWNRSAWHMERLRSITPPKLWLRVRYEDLCADPAAQIKRALGFLGIAHGEPMLAFRGASHHIIGNRMRLGDGSEIRLDTSWQNDLSKDQVDQILRDTSKYRRLLGYDS
jgi:hypothetical protein